MSGPHFREYYLLVDEQRDQIFARTDPIGLLQRLTNLELSRAHSNLGYER
jgi:hypothetical protein